MSHKSTDFPQYRKFSNEKVFYRIRSDRDFDEIQLFGSKGNWFSMHASQYPEIIRVMEMLDLTQEGILISDESEFVGIAEKYGHADRL